MRDGITYLTELSMMLTPGNKETQGIFLLYLTQPK